MRRREFGVSQRLAAFPGRAGVGGGSRCGNQRWIWVGGPPTCRSFSPVFLTFGFQVARVGPWEAGSTTAPSSPFLSRVRNHIPPHRTSPPHDAQADDWASPMHDRTSSTDNGTCTMKDGMSAFSR
ncbi:hypothetical protein MA16_Dca019685 [Dendrobium catenatum]|uniref:Uncharacterized protein n=1 Tax=Dendrobium catenatum TaxID=906689 RepID=A0A2I0VDF3_9ASPA|nr:hypothetical protein MA16_Dca019685 [Dendrobium catenatum]